MKNLKKKLLTGFAATCALAFAFGFSACEFPMDDPAENGDVADFTYELVGDSYTILGRGTDDSGILEFPSEYNGKPVTAIAAGAFSGDDELGIAIIPDSITSIGENAFYNCVNMQEVTIGDGVTVIPSGAFMNCIFLNSIDLPSGLVSIGEGAFQKCSKLRKIEFPDTVKTIGKRAFYNCTWLKTVDFSTSLESIGIEAFANCVAIEAVVIPDGAPTQIADRAFAVVDDPTGDLKMKNRRIELGNGVLSVGSRAFEGHTYVRRLVFGDSLQNLAVNAFYKCTRVFSITVGKKAPICAVSGEEGPFTGCNRIREVIDGSGTLQLGSTGLGGILADVWSVKKPTEQSSISIDETSHLVYYTGTNPYGLGGVSVIASLLDELTEAQDVVIPDTYQGQPVTTIAKEAFYNDLGVKSLDTGANCQYIGYSAFRNAYALLSLKIGANVKTIADYAFLNTNGLSKVYFNCGTNLTSVGTKAFYKKRGHDGVELAGVPYADVYFNGTQAQFNTVKTVILGADGKKGNDDLFTTKVNFHYNWNGVM